MTWRNRPTIKKNWNVDNTNIEYIIFIDESGDSSLNGIIKNLEKGNKINKANCIFTISGCIIKKESFPKIKNDIMELKYKYWDDGKFLYKRDGLKRVSFHSYHIRQRLGPFNSNIINTQNFLNDLSTYMEQLDIKIISAAINKLDLCQKYKQPQNPYELGMKFILERLILFLNKNDKNAKIIIVLESRGKKEDKSLLNYVKSILDEGTEFIKKEDFNKISGVYFNEKWCKDSKNQKSYIGLEIADLICYPIAKYCKNGTKDKAFTSIEHKFIGEKSYNGIGLKFFP